ncbi:MAG: energy-coupling factor transporter transmembrane protein EcfT [Deltaproteobacteria bacterium]|jgi:cobalt/nickel transport system permease protein|nr:energy-coupling factor transporter transmembrane protein EcfT [Deltaproteobacteria bacterium]
MERTERKNSVFFINSVDPRLKVVVLAVWSALLAILETREGAAAGFFGSLILAAFSGKLFSPGSLWKVLAVNVFLIFIWLFLPFSYAGGVPAGSVLGFAFTREGVDLSIVVSVKALAITLGAASIIGDSSVHDLLAGARALGVPEKMIALMLLMTRYIQVVGDEYRRLRNAMRIRGFRARVSGHALKSVANLCGMLLVRGFERADRVLAAMLCRGYRGRFWIKFERRFGLADLLFVITMCLLIFMVEYRDAV